jgi:hypothetical protein
MASQLGAAPVEGGVVKPIWFTEVSTAAAFEGTRREDEGKTKVSLGASSLKKKDRSISRVVTQRRTG